MWWPKNKAKKPTPKQKLKFSKNKFRPFHRYPELILPSGKHNYIPQIEEKDTSDYAKIYVGNLLYEVTEEEIEKVFRQFGEVSDIIIPKDFHSGNSKGFAFVEFEKKESVKKALYTKTPILINGRKVYPQEFKQ